MNKKIIYSLSILCMATNAFGMEEKNIKLEQTNVVPKKYSKFADTKKRMKEEIIKTSGLTEENACKQATAFKWLMTLKATAKLSECLLRHNANFTSSDVSVPEACSKENDFFNYYVDYNELGKMGKILQHKNAVGGFNQ